MNIKQTIQESLSRTAMMFVTFLLAMTSQTAWAQEPTFSGGEGTPENPYKISSAADLEQLAADVNNDETSYEEFYFIVTQDITYDYASLGENESNYTAIGCDGYPFKGHFDGNGKTISGICIYKSDGEGRQGLFGIIEEPAVVENVTLTDTRITAGAQTGGIVGNNKGGEIINCHVTNTVEILGIGENDEAHGGIVGSNSKDSTGEIDGTVSGCISEATLANVSRWLYGGIAGENYGTLENNFVIGATIPTASYDNNQGAIVGYNYNEGTLANNYYTACTVAGVENSTNVGVGVDDNDQPVGDVAENDGALSVHQIILAEGVTGVTINAEATYSYDSKDYYAPGTTVVITYSDTSVMGFQFCGINTGEVVTGELSGNKYTFTMPADDVTMTDEWGVTDGADGSEAKPYVITTPAGLDLLAKMVEAYNYFEGKYFKLGDDITYDYASLDENESNYTAIGGNGLPFEGHFDGNGKTISGIRIYNSDDEGRQGLFGDIMAPAVVENLTLTDTRIAAGTQTGGIVGVNNGANVINCHVTNTVEILGIGENDSFHGGIVGINGIDGENVGTVSGCISEATLSNVSGFSYGGIAGQNFGTLENNFVIGATIPAATDDSHGAIVGYYNDGTLKNNYYTACTVADVKNATNVGVGIDNNDQPVGDVTENDGALSVHQITLAEGVKDVTFDTSAKVYSYDSKDYYAQGTTVKLTYTGTPGMGYEFIGINAGEGVTGTLSDNVYTITMPANDVTVASVDIKAITYTITYEGVDGVTMPEGTVKEYTVETASFKLPESLEKDHYVFTGWTYEGQTEPTKTVTIAKGSTGDKTFTANWKKLLTNTDITVSTIADQTYTGSEIKPAITVKDGTTDITDQCDFTYNSNKVVGTAEVVISAKESSAAFAGEKTVTFKIAPKTVSTPTITLSGTSFEYSGEAIKPTVTVKDGETTIPAEEYTVGYSNNIEAGTATVTITDNEGGNYTVSGTATFTITPKPNTAVVNVEETPVAIGGETYYGLTKEAQEVIKDKIEVPIAMTAAASNRVEVTAEGSLKFSQGPSTTIALPKLKLGDIIKLFIRGIVRFNDDGSIFIVKSLTRGDGDTSSDGMIDLVSGAEYKVLKDGALVLTIVLENEEAVIEGITVTEPEPEPEPEPTPEEVPVTITKAGQVPYYSEYNLDFTDKPELKAYVATGYDKAKGTIWLTRVKQVPAETGFLLIGDQGDYDIPTIDGVSDVYYKNMFKGTLEGTTIQTTDGDYTNYYLSSGASGVGFYKVTNPEGQKIGANRCYLPILTDIPANGSEGDAEVIKVSAAKQVPYYTSKNIDFSSLEAQGVKAYTATGYNYESGIIWLTRVKKVPAKTGILVMADKEGDYNVPTASVQSVYENMFVGSETAQTIYTNETIGGVDYVNYYLSKGDAGVGFYKVTNPDGVKMGANRCYLPIPKRDAASGARGKNGESAFCKMILSDESNDDVIAIPVFGGMNGEDDGTTGIDIQSSIFNLQSNEVYYNLQGQRIDRPGKGLYIRNGRVVVIRQ